MRESPFGRPVYVRHIGPSQPVAHRLNSPLAAARTNLLLGRAQAGYTTRHLKLVIAVGIAYPEVKTISK